MSEMILKTILTTILGAAILVAAPTLQAAAGQSSGSGYLDALRKNLGARKASIVAETLELNDADRAIFDTIYSAYQADLSKLNDERIAIIQEFVSDLINISDDKARELIARSFNYQKNRMALLEKTTNKISDSLSPIVAGRFYQIENQLLGVIDADLAAELPLVPSRIAHGMIE